MGKSNGNLIERIKVFCRGNFVFDRKLLHKVYGKPGSRTIEIVREHQENAIVKHSKLE